MLANVLVVMAIWLSYSGRTVTDKLLAIIFPITAFVASGFEHSIANMYFIPFGLILKSSAQVQAALFERFGYLDLSSLTTTNFLVKNLIPVTLGNIIGGGLLVGAVYWFVYLHKK